MKEPSNLAMMINTCSDWTCLVSINNICKLRKFNIQKFNLTSVLLPILNN